MTLQNDCKQSSTERELSEDILALVTFALEMATSAQELKNWFDYNSKQIFRLTTDHKEILRERYKSRQDMIRRNG